MDRTEALTAVLVAAEQVLRTVGPCDLGTPQILVPVGLLVQLANAVGAVGEAIAPDAPYGHQEGQSAALGANRDSDQSTSRPEGRTARIRARPKHPNCGGCGCDHCQAMTAFPSDPPAYWCKNPECWDVLTTPDSWCTRHRPANEAPSPLCRVTDCWRVADLPTGTCHHHSAFAALPSTRVVCMDPVFRAEEA